MKSMYWWDYTSNELRDLVPQCVIFQPIGSVEQHRHLPVATDSLISTDISCRLAEKMEKEGYPALFLPLLPYGKSNEHLKFPGTVTYSAETYLKVLMDIGRSVARAGAKKFVFLNAHGGNSEVLDVACRELRIETGMQVFSVHPLGRLGVDMSYALTAQEKKLGIHAGRKETSVVLRLAPDMVDTSNMEKDYSVDFTDYKYIDYSGRVSFGWMTQDVSRSGAVGNPEGASAEEGEMILSRAVKALYVACLEIQKFEFIK